MTFKLPIPSANLRQANGRDGYKYRDLRNAWETAAIVAVRAAAIPVATVKRRMLVTRYYGGSGHREYDPDNMVAGAKPVVDALRKAGALKDDSSKWAEISYRQVKSKPARVEVLVEEVASGAS